MSKSRRSIHSYEPHRFLKEHRKIDPHEKRRLLRAHSNVLREQSETERHKSLLRVGRTVLSVVARDFLLSDLEGPSPQGLSKVVLLREDHGTLRRTLDDNDEEDEVTKAVSLNARR